MLDSLGVFNLPTLNLHCNLGAQVVPLSPPAGTHMPLSPADLYGMWYPTVRRALQAISKMKRSLDVRYMTTSFSLIFTYRNHILHIFILLSLH